ncbi:ABC transporter permease [Pseudoduganella lutea]|uniref:ABC transporter permease n=1 Tax=Pseudoduganella lutea TaxID=321985 RepID=A0A4P6KVU6_9BURK|nr:ABC transporter permease [Pseudoduganella lutea]QBE63080.1 ABC transporter permease [Pseudoduganella lutea]
MTAILALIRKDLLLYINDRRALVIHLLVPVIVAAFFGSLFGGAGNGQGGKIDIAVVQQDRSSLATQVTASLKADPNLRVQVLPLDDARGRVAAGKVTVAIVIPAGFGDAAAGALAGAGGVPELPLLYDPSHATVLAMVKGLLMHHVMQHLNAQVFARAAGPGVALPPGAGKPFATREKAVSAGPAYDAYAHSFAGMGVQFILFMGVDWGIGLLTARRTGIWSRLLAAPVTQGQVLLSRLLSGTIIAAVLLVTIFLCAVVLFGVTITNPLGFMLVTLGFALMTATFGILVAALGRTPEATRGIATFATLMIVMLGGAWVPSFIFPEWLQQASLMMPARWAIDGLDAVTWRGLGMEAALRCAGVQLGFAVLFGLVAAWRFKARASEA